MKKNIIIFVLVVIANSISAQKLDIDLTLELNTGMLFATPGNDIGEVAKKGDDGKFIGNVGAQIIRFNWTDESKWGITLNAFANYDRANFLSTDAISQVDVNAISYGGRIYPIANDEFVLDALGALDFDLPNLGVIGVFLVDIPVMVVLWSTVNSLHFDYGIGNATLKEYSFLDDPNFPESTVDRDVKYVGWGVHPQLFQTEEKDLTFIALFDFGKYTWTNANGGTSSFSANSVGFGMSYNF